MSIGRASHNNRTDSAQAALLNVTVFASGAATMALEMCTSRLLAPYYGNSLPVWGLLIGMLLAYLAVGHALGGWLADRCPRSALLYELAAVAGLAIGFLPHVASPILRHSIVGFTSYQSAMVIGALFAVVVLLAVPTVLLGCIFPFAARLRLSDPSHSGTVTGRLYALSTLGSLVGTFMPVFVLIPNWGTRRTLFVVSMSVLAITIVGMRQCRLRRLWLYLAVAAVVTILYFLPQGPIKPVSGLIYEMESSYNYIQLIEDGDSILLKLNEGEGIQSVHRRDSLLTGYVYDYFLLAPFFRSQPQATSPDSLCLIGLAGGTMATQYSAVYGPITIDGLEIDPALISVAKSYMGADLPNVRALPVDGRYFLATTAQTYDVIIVDAYIPPYIPFHLTTAEFFSLVWEHLTHDGVLALNIARTEDDYSLVNAIAFTLRRVFPSVYLMDTQSNLNTIVIASRQPTRLEDVATSIANTTDPVLKQVAARAAGRAREFTAHQGQLLVDDHAPVEQITHAVVVRYLLGGPHAP